MDETTILTAAHCFLGQDPEDESKMKIIVGANQPTNEDSLEERHRQVSRKKIKSVKIHPDYNREVRACVLKVTCYELHK